MMMYTVDFSYWHSGSGFSHTETFESGEADDVFTAKEYATNADVASMIADGNEAILVKVSFYETETDPMFSDPVCVDECTINADGTFWD